MRCRKVQRLLDDYLRGELTSRDRESVASHLASCAKCGAELEFLKSYREELASIPAHRAPVGFLDRVRDGLSAEDAKKIPARDRGIIERLFLPLKIKLPLEAAGLLATAFLIIVFMRPLLDEPGRQMRGEIQDSTAAAPEARERSIKKAANYHVAVNSLKQKTRLYRPSAEKPAPPVEIDLAVAAQQQYRDESASDALRSVREEQEAPVAPGAGGQVAETARSRSSRDDTIGGTAPARQATVQLTGEDQIVQIKNMIGPLGGRIISENRTAGKKPAYIRVELPETNYARFVEQLGQVGQITRRPAQRAVQNRRSIDVQVNVLEQK